MDYLITRDDAAQLNLAENEMFYYDTDTGDIISTEKILHNDTNRYIPILGTIGPHSQVDDTKIIKSAI